jgi:DNA-binding FadR family transcriptional regulator
VLPEIQTQRVDRRRLYQQIADDIERLILDGTFPPESRLPSEQELAVKYGVSRNVIREALKSLKELVWSASGTGSGTLCQASDHENPFPKLNPSSHSLPEFSGCFYELDGWLNPTCVAGWRR